ncbi:hypothetical protein [Xylanimonas allomyrinae]|uniref:hypothetical protein n=1 Tax=Xylanimonas allomyrinae TaxID=2509459 RepID=UPI001FE99E6C|nr:hypothetical protein [Xylanimonas allomyrinae]
MALAWNWHRPVWLVDADPVGGSAILAGIFRGMREYEAGLVELALSPLDTADALLDVGQPVEGTSVTFVPGPRSRAQVPSLEPMWGRLGDALDDLDKGGQDVIVDAGRLGMRGSPEPLLALADLTLVVTRANLVALSAVRSWASPLAERSPAWRDPGLLVVGAGRPYPSKEVAEFLGLPVVASVHDDARAAGVYHSGLAPERKWATGTYARSVRGAADAITSRIARGRAELLEGVTS